jgi:hypothetical protein
MSNIMDPGTWGSPEEYLIAVKAYALDVQRGLADHLDAHKKTLAQARELAKRIAVTEGDAEGEATTYVARLGITDAIASEHAKPCPEDDTCTGHCTWNLAAYFEAAMNRIGVLEAQLALGVQLSVN